MSAAASRLELETFHDRGIGLSNASESVDTTNERRECELLEELAEITPSDSSAPVIAIDMDDVLCETNKDVAEWHNEVYGTEMDLSNFYYFYYWKNPYWGTLEETMRKVAEYYKAGRIYQTDPVKGGREGIQALKDMGFRLIIVTARADDTADKSWEWVTKYYPGLFDSIICTGQFKDAHKTGQSGHEVVTKLSKSQVCEDLGAKLLIDDSAENMLKCVTATKPTPVLLFGSYEWNQRVSNPGDTRDDMSFDIRFKACGGKEFWKEEALTLPEGAPVWRVKDWGEVIRWVREAKAEGRI